MFSELLEQAPMIDKRERKMLTDEELANRLQEMVKEMGWPSRTLALQIVSTMLSRAASCPDQCDGCKMIAMALIAAQTDLTSNMLLYGERYTPEGIIALAQTMSMEEFQNLLLKRVETEEAVDDPLPEPQVIPGDYEYYWGFDKKEGTA